MGLTLSRRNCSYGNAIGRMGSRDRWREFEFRDALVSHSVRADLRHFLFLAHFAATKTPKQQKALLEALKKGDKVVTASGIWGTVTNLGKETVTLQIADSAKIRIQREQIARLRGGDEEDKDKDS